MSNATVKTRILIISDTHCAALERRDDAAFSLPLPSADLLIHCGDLTMTGEMDQYGKTLDMLRLIDAPVKLVIAGNHDLSLDEDFVFNHISADHNDTKRKARNRDEAGQIASSARDLWTAASGRAKREGVTFLDEGAHHISLPNGAQVQVYASPYTPEFDDWAFAYKRDEDRFNSPADTLVGAKNVAPYPVPAYASTERPIDIMVTHGPPFAKLDETTRREAVGCEHLLHAVMRARPLLHCFGHIHEAHGAEIVRWARDVDQVVASRTSLGQWKDGAWRRGVVEEAQTAPLNIDVDATENQNGVFLDISQGSGTPLKRGHETLMINAAIMDVTYFPDNAPFVVDIDLPMLIQESRE